jgi:hypothetical protein
MASIARNQLMPGRHEPEEGPCQSCSAIVPADVEEIIAVMRAAGDGDHGRRLRGLIKILWRAGLRVHRCSRQREYARGRQRSKELPHSPRSTRKATACNNVGSRFSRKSSTL